jgi:hypothetical protein
VQVPALAQAPAQAAPAPPPPAVDDANSAPAPPPAKKSRTNTPWTPAEELRLKQMRDAGNSWAEIAKVSTVELMSREDARGLTCCRRSPPAQKAA